MSQLPEDGDYEYPDYEPHPVAAIFPMLDEEELKKLAADIKANGLCEPIVTFGRLLVDGRNRLAACELEGIEPEFVEWDGDEDEIIPWILSKNLHRRHLTPSQRAAIADSLATLPAHRPEGGKSAGIPTQAQAAKMMGVSERLVRDARKVRESGDEALIEAVKSGEVAVSAAAAQLRPAPPISTSGDLATRVATIERYLQRYDSRAERPIQLAMARSVVGEIPEPEWRALIEQGRTEGRWQTSSSIVDGRLIGTIWLPARQRPEREATGGEASSRTSVEPASVASLSLSSMPPLWAARATRLVAKLDQGHGGSARLVELRHSSRESLGQLGEDGWETLLREGARAGLWVLEDDRIRLVRAPTPSSDGDTDTDTDEDIEDEAPEGPVLPSDPDDPAVQGHMAAGEDDEDIEDDDTDDTTTDAEGADAAQVAAAGADVSGAERPVAPTFFARTVEGGRRYANSPTVRPYAEHAQRILSETFDGAVALPELRRVYEQARGHQIANAHWFAIVGAGLEANLWEIEGEEDGQILIGKRKVRPAAMPPDDLPASKPAELPNDERADLDAYYTPDLHARALVRWLAANVYAGQDPTRIREPSAGGGAWLRACRDQWPEAHLRACDIDPKAAGLALADRSEVGDFLALDLESSDLIVGNPPYGGDLVAWIDRSRELAPVVGYLLRSTFLGAAERLEWWQRRPPSDVIVVLPRPAWEGPGKRATTDRVDSLFIVWRGAVAGSTRLHWLDAREGA